MATMGVRVRENPYGNAFGDLADTLATAMFGDPKQEMDIARLRSDLLTDEYNRRQIDSAIAYNQARTDDAAWRLKAAQEGVAPAGKIIFDSQGQPVATAPAEPAPVEAAPVELSTGLTAADLVPPTAAEPVPVTVADMPTQQLPQTMDTDLRPTLTAPTLPGPEPVPVEPAPVTSMPQTVLPGPADTIASPDQIAQPVPVLDDTETAATEPAVTVPPRLTQAEADALAAAGIASGGNIGQQIGTSAGLAGLTYGDPRNLTEQQRAAIKYTGSVPAQSSILGTTGNAADLELVQKLRKEFEGLPEFQAWSIVNTGYQNMLSAMDTIASLSDETDPKRGPADMRLLYNYLRLLDPRTGIKEGEYATAEQAGGKVAPLLNLWNSIVSGDKLDAPTREAFMREAKGMYDVASQTLTPHIEKLTKEAEIGKIDPGRVVTKPAPSRTFGDTVFDDADIAATMKANPTMTRQQVIDALVAKGMTYGGT